MKTMRTELPGVATSGGMVTTALAALVAGGPLALLVLQDWYVDVNAPGCGTGTGTEFDPFCAIMDAVAAATDGDTIHIAPGTYFENVFLAKDLDLVGTGGEQVTIVDGGGAGRVVHVLDSVVSLTGLTLTNGDAGSGVGGGLFAQGTGYYPDDRPLVLLTSSTVTGNSAGSGGGVGVSDYPDDGLCELVDCLVEANSATSQGGGLYVYGASRLMGTTVTANSAPFGGGMAGTGEVVDSLITGNLAYVGGGIATWSMTLTNSTVSANEAASGAGIYLPPPSGGIIAPPPHIDITSSHIDSNVASYRGGGLHVIRGAATITGSTVTANSVLAGDGGGIAGSGYLSLANTVVAANTATTYGGGLSCQDVGLSITNSTVALNAGGGIGGYDIYDQVYGVPGGIQNSIFWQNGGSSIDCSSGCGNLTVEHSLVQGGWPGAGNLDADPLFVDAASGDYRLLSTSPCIDAGDNTAVPPGLTTDLRGAPRFVDDPFTPDTGVGAAPVVDMGAFEFFRRFRDARGVPVNPAPPRSVP